MRWDFVVEQWIARLNADPALLSVLGGGNLIYPAQASRPVTVPSIEYLVSSDTEGELFNPITVVVDFWARGIKKSAQIERRIRLLTHSDVGQDVGGERMWLQYQDGRTLEYPKEEGVVHRQLEFLFTPMREKYAVL